MSLAFSDTTTKKGIIQLIEKEIGGRYGDISGNSNRLKETTADINTAWDDYIPLAFKGSGMWQYDDSNHTDYPVIKTALVSGRRDYPFTTDENSNLILDVFRVAILPSATATLYEVIDPVDVPQGGAPDIVAESTVTGVPATYDKTANAVFLDPAPSYSVSAGLKLFINREPSYFTTSDTTKKPGCPGVHHRYFVAKAAYAYARRNSLRNAGLLLREVQKFEGDEERGIIGSIERHFARRSRDERPRITMKRINFI